MYHRITVGLLYFMVLQFLQPSLLEAKVSRQGFFKVTACALALSGVGLGVNEYSAYQSFKDRKQELQTRSDKMWKGHIRLDEGRLSSTWQNDYTGTDLVKNEIYRFGPVLRSGIAIVEFNRIDLSALSALDLSPNFASNLSLSSPQIALRGFSAGSASNHPTNVASIMFNDPFGSSAVGQLQAYVGLNGDLKRGLSLIQDPRVRVVNYSMVFSGLDELSKNQEFLKQLWDGKINVFGVGNKSIGPILSFAKNIVGRQMDNAEEGFPGVIVGSMDPEGHISKFSISGSDVTILAPADLILQTSHYPYRSEDQTTFGMTSGAAPFVSGHEADIAALLEEWSLEHSLLLHKHTALPVPATEHHKGQHGYGLLNAYKRFRVAGRLKNKGWAQASPTERLQWLEDPKTYDFSVEVKYEREFIERRFKDLSAEERIDAYRRVFFLEPTKTVAQKIAELYRAEGLETNARFFTNVSFLLI